MSGMRSWSVISVSPYRTNVISLLLMIIGAVRDAVRLGSGSRLQEELLVADSAEAEFGCGYA